jgi:hypothetical protein
MEIKILAYSHLKANWKIKVSQTQILMQATGVHHDKPRTHQYRRRKDCRGGVMVVM